MRVLSWLMTTTAVRPRPVTHRTKPWLGTGIAIRMHGNTTAEVKWPGPGLTRREEVGNLDPGMFPQSWPLPVERRRAA